MFDWLVGTDPNGVAPVTPSLSVDETEKAKAMLKQEAEDDDFKDAVEEEEVDTNGNFQVTVEELAIIRAELATEFPDDYNYLSDAYILSVASKPYSKDTTIRRPLEVRRLGRSTRTLDSSLS
jgi:hypothetical protein